MSATRTGKPRRSDRRSNCPISFGLDIFGDKWSLLIIRDIMFYGRSRYSDFAPREHIATNILADRLRSLEDAGIVEKRRDGSERKTHEYAVTATGRALLPTLVEMTLWGLRYDPETPASDEFLARVDRDARRVAREVARAIDRGEFAKYRREQMGIEA